MENNYDRFVNYLNHSQVFPKLKEKISVFAIAWYSYEAEFFDNDYKPQSLYPKIIKNIRLEDNEKDAINNLYTRLLTYFEQRNIGFDLESIWKAYRFESGFNKNSDRYEDNIRTTKNIIRKLMNPQDEKDKLQFILMITARVRNNLFHGLKPLHELNENEELLNVAIETLILVFINRRYF